MTHTQRKRVDTAANQCDVQFVAHASLFMNTIATAVVPVDEWIMHKCIEKSEQQRAIATHRVDDQYARRAKFAFDASRAERKFHVLLNMNV